MAQVVDGKWQLVPSGVRTVETGYDRTIAFGDVTWSDYQVTVPVTVHSLSSTAPHAGVGVAAGWQGHAGAERPRLDWPLGSLCFYYRRFVDDPYQLHLMQFASPMYVAADGGQTQLALGVEHVLKLRAEVLSDTETRYSCKLWPSSTSEPQDWSVSAVLARRPGSVLLVAHHADLTFGNVVVEPLR